MNWLVLVLVQLVVTHVAFGETREEYARKCEQAIGAVIPGFNCLSGTIIPMDNVTSSGTCPTPPLLGGHGCHKYARTGRINTSNPDVDIQFMCRHYESTTANDPFFKDIAMIARNVKNGAACFFQTDIKQQDGTNVPAPSQGSSFWQSPQVVGSSGTCLKCHDADPFIRSPYMKQVQGRDALPARRNDPAHYWFPGVDFAHWKAFRIATSNPNMCTQCHVIGTNNLNNTLGSAGQLGAYSVAKERFPLDSSGNAWMNLVPNANPRAAFDQMEACARNHNASGCRVELRTNGSSGGNGSTLQWVTVPNSSYSVAAGQSVAGIYFEARSNSAVQYSTGRPQQECVWDRFRQNGSRLELIGNVPQIGQPFTTNGTLLRQGLNVCNIIVVAAAGGQTITRAIQFSIQAGSGSGQLVWHSFPGTQNIRAGDSIDLAVVAGGVNQIQYRIGHPNPECSWDRPSQQGQRMIIRGTAPVSGRYTIDGRVLTPGVNTCFVTIIAEGGGQSIQGTMRFNINR